ncbi:hypothetical protein FS749_005304 [Ceratobasidium sp. UAMH 11750]|nr:hypothetical protein FS749_005304 [Ceratobasidium sp. UAMH 11750]
MPAETFDDHPPPLQPPFELQPSMAAPYDYAHPFASPPSAPSPWDSPQASSSARPRGHSRQRSASSVPAYVPVNTGRRGSAKDPEALQAAIERTKNSRKRRTNSTASALPADDELDDKDSPEDSTSALRQRQEDARLIRCDAEQQRRNELGKGYDRLRAALNRGDERLSKARVVERATARVVQLRDQNSRMQDELLRKQELIKELNRANEKLMLDASGAAPLLASSPASSPSSGRPGSSSHTSVSAFNVGQPGHTHDRSSSLPTPPHTHTGLQYPGESNPEFSLAPTMYKQDPFAYGPFEGNSDDHIYPQVGGPVAGGPEFFVPRGAPPVGLNPLAGHPRSESPRSYEHGQAFGLPGGDDGHWLPEGVPQWNATSSGLPGTFTHQPHSFTSSPSREGLNELSEVPATGFPGW